MAKGVKLIAQFLILTTSRSDGIVPPLLLHLDGFMLYYKEYFTFGQVLFLIYNVR
jgi:hypothetical protein